MRKTKNAEAWVVYKMTAWGKADGPNAVCEQGEWDEMQRANPGQHTLIRKGLTSEAEAERLARESPGGTADKGARLKAR
jgi:hypothetical protein